VNSEVKREELLDFVNGNSKEVQYSDQISAIDFHKIVQASRLSQNALKQS